MENILAKLLSSSYSLLDTAHRLPLPELLPVLATSDISIETARKTLRWLRNLQNISYDMENWLQLDSLPEQQAKTKYLEKLINVYAGQVKIANLSNPDLLKHFTIEHANNASGSVALSAALHTLESLPDNSTAIDDLDKQLDNILPEWNNRQGQSVEQLVDAIESGITHLVGKPLGDRSPVDRLIEVSNNLQEAVRQLYSIDTLDDPVREESIELAREILRKLRNLSFSDRNIEDAIDTGRPSEKLAFAQRISEMVNMYKNLLFEAMRSNPNIINDIRVRNATDAASDCSHGIKLMAAKEIPNEASSLHDISADLEHTKNDKTFQNASLNKLMHKMEGGVEHAAEEVEARRKHELKATSEAEVAARAEALRRRRRRRRQQQGRGASGGNDALRAANVALHKAVVNEVRADSKGVSSLNDMDRDAVRKAGSSLRSSNKQANALLTTVSLTDNNKIKPDDKGFSARERDPLNPNNPRNRPRIV